MTALKDKLTPKTLDQLRTRQLTNRTLAAQLEVSETHLSRVLSSLGQTKDKGQTAQAREALSEAYHDQASQRSTLARKVAAKKTTITKAANLAGCSERTMWRYVAALKD